MTTRIAHAQYKRPNGAQVRLVLNRYENEPDFQAFAITRFVDPHDPAFATFAGFDIRPELEELLDGQVSDAESPEFVAAREAVLAAFDRGEAV